MSSKGHTLQKSCQEPHVFRRSRQQVTGKPTSHCGQSKMQQKCGTLSGVPGSIKLACPPSRSSILYPLGFLQIYREDPHPPISNREATGLLARQPLKSLGGKATRKGHSQRRVSSSHRGATEMRCQTRQVPHRGLQFSAMPGNCQSAFFGLIPKCKRPTPSSRYCGSPKKQAHRTLYFQGEEKGFCLFCF